MEKDRYQEILVGRYWLFAGECYYPRGGFDDFVGAADTVEGAKKLFDQKRHDWAHIVDSGTSAIISIVDNNANGIFEWVTRVEEQQ